MVNKVSEGHGLTEDGKTVAPLAPPHFTGAGADVVEGTRIVVGMFEA